jgi:hypothetical protein
MKLSEAFDSKPDSADVTLSGRARAQTSLFSRLRGRYGGKAAGVISWALIWSTDETHPKFDDSCAELMRRDDATLAYLVRAARASVESAKDNEWRAISLRIVTNLQTIISSRGARAAPSLTRDQLITAMRSRRPGAEDRYGDWVDAVLAGTMRLEDI